VAIPKRQKGEKEKAQEERRSKRLFWHLAFFNASRTFREATAGGGGESQAAAALERSPAN